MRPTIRDRVADEVDMLKLLGAMGLMLVAALALPLAATSMRPFASMRDAAMRPISAQGSSAPDLTIPTFDLVAGATSPNDLPDTLTINGTAMELVLACDAEDRSGTSLVCRDAAGGVTLVETGAGTSPTSSTVTPFHATDSAEREITTATSQKYFAGSVAGVGDITVEDFMVEVVYRHVYDGAGQNDNIVNKRSGGNGTGWSLQAAGGTSVTFNLDDADSAITSVFGTSIVTGAWHYIAAFVDRDESSSNGSFVFTNGIRTTGVDMSTNAGTLTNATPGSVGSGAGLAGSSMAGPIASLRVRKCPTATPQCFAGGATNDTQWNAVADAHTSIAFGASPTIAAGSDVPTTMTRSVAGMTDVLDGGVRSLFNIGANAPRVACRPEGASTVCGYLSEPQTTNICLQSQTCDNATWTKEFLAVTADAVAAPDGTTTADALVSVAGSLGSFQRLVQTITTTAATHTASVWIKPGTGARNQGVLLYDTLSANGVCFNQSTCATTGVYTGSPTAVAVGESWGNGWCRVSMTYTASAGATGLALYPTDDPDSCGVTDHTNDAAGGGVLVDAYVWGFELEAFPTATSYQVTTTAASTRVADLLTFDGVGHFTGSPMTIESSILCPSFDFNTGSGAVFAGAGPDATNRVDLRLNPTGDAFRAFGVVGGATQWDYSSASDITDGVSHAVRTTATTNAIASYLDGVSTGTDAVASVPAAAVSSATSGVWLGSTGGTGAQSACLIKRARVWSGAHTPASVP